MLVDRERSDWAPCGAGPWCELVGMLGPAPRCHAARSAASRSRAARAGASGPQSRGSGPSLLRLRCQPRWAGSRARAGRRHDGGVGPCAGGSTRREAGAPGCLRCAPTRSPSTRRTAGINVTSVVGWSQWTTIIGIGVTRRASFPRPANSASWKQPRFARSSERCARASDRKDGTVYVLATDVNQVGGCDVLGATGAQRVFRSSGGAFCGTARSEALRRRLAISDVHSGVLVAIGTVSNGPSGSAVGCMRSATLCAP